MTATVIPLESLAQHIAQQQSELESLRQEYETRQARLADLKGRKEELETQLQQIDAQIQTVARGEAPLASGAVPSRRPVASTRKVRPVPGQRLPDLLVEMVRRVKGPVTVKQMAEEVVRQKFPTNSKDISRLVQTRVQELIAKRVFQRLKDHRGVVLAGSNRDLNSQAAKAASTKKAVKKAVSSKTTSPVERNGSKQPSLMSLLTEVLAKSRRPLTGRELAEQALAQDYKTKSKNFLDVIYVTLSKMDNIDKIPGKGYCLKKTQG